MTSRFEIKGFGLSVAILGFWAILGWWTSIVHANNQSLTSGVYAGTLGAGGATAAERHALGQNPAALGPLLPYRPANTLGITRTGFHLDYHHPYGLQDLSVSEMGGYADFKRGGVSLAWKETGVDGLFQEQAYAINPGIRLGNPSARFLGQLDLGAQWTISRSTIAGEKSVVELNQTYGFVWNLFPRLKMGAFTSGGHSHWSESWAKDRVIQWGFAAHSRDPDLVVNKIGLPGHSLGSLQSLYLDFRKTGEASWKSLAAMTFSPHPALRISTGFSSPPFQFSLGIHLNWQGLQWHQSLRYHRYLGRTCLTGLAYERTMQ